MVVDLEIEYGRLVKASRMSAGWGTHLKHGLYITARDSTEGSFILIFPY